MRNQRRQRIKAGDRWVHVTEAEAADDVIYKALGILPIGNITYECIQGGCPTKIKGGYYNIGHATDIQKAWRGECFCIACASPSIKYAAISVTEYLRQEGAE